MYVYVMLAGAHTIPEAIKASDKGSFLCWILVKEIDFEYNADHFLEFENSRHAKALGIRWNAQSDEFYFTTIPFESKQKVTKRIVLSQI